MSRQFYKLRADLAADPDQTPAAKMILAYLEDRMGDDGVAWPGHRAIALALALNRETVAECIYRLERGEWLTVERRGNGRSDCYRLGRKSGRKTPPVQDGESGRKTPPVQEGESGRKTPPVQEGESGRKTQPDGKPNRPENPTGGGRKTQPEVVGKPSHIQREPLNQNKRASDKQTPALAPGDDFQLTEDADSANAEAQGGGKGDVQRLVGLWIGEFERRTGERFAQGGRDRLAGTIKNMLASFAADKLAGAIPRWFARNGRASYGVGLFKHCLEDGDADLTGRAVDRRGSAGNGQLHPATAAAGADYGSVGRRHEP